MERLASHDIMKRTGLYRKHIELGAKMVSFAGWEMPVEYPIGSIREHKIVRESAGVFDIAHMAKFTIEGEETLPYLQRTMTRDFSPMKVGETYYSLVCTYQGGVIDDVFVYRLAENSYFVMTNAANREKDYRWFEKQRTRSKYTDLRIEDVSTETYALALQGPRAQEVLQRLTAANLAFISHHNVAEISVAGELMLVARTGYTGEDGFELFFPEENAEKVWEEILEAGAQPIGLAARDSLRFEACLPLYGHELTLDINPLEAGLGWAVGFKKEDYFVGKNALLQIKQEGPKRKLVGLEMIEKGVPRHGYDVVVDEGVIGKVTSGMYSPSNKKFFALALVPRQYSAVGESVGVVIRDQVHLAKVVSTPFYPQKGRR